MNEAMVSAAMSQAMQLDAFWTTLASHAAPATQLALAGTARVARDAVVQCARKATLTLKVWPPSSPDTLGLLRTSGRTLSATVAINNNTQPRSPLIANHIARLSMHQLRCGAVTSLELGGGPWLVDTALLADICAALPGLSKLVLSNVSTHPHPPAAPALAWPSLRTLQISPSSGTAGINDPARTAHLLAALGVRAGGSVINLTFDSHTSYQVIGRTLTNNQMHALRKLTLPHYEFSSWGAEKVGSALIRHAPALEHLQVYRLAWNSEDEHHDTSAMCVAWRIVEMQQLDVACCGGLPLGTYPGQPPLILRVMSSLSATDVDGDGELPQASAHHLTSPAPGNRRVQLECTPAAYTSLDSAGSLAPILRVLTLSGDLSNLILDGIDSADDIKDLVELNATGIYISFDEDGLLDLADLVGLHDLPRVTKVEFSADHEDTWEETDEQLLAVLPAHVTDVHLSGCQGGPSLELVSRMCVHMSRLPHRQAHPLRLCVEDGEGWFDAAVRAIQAAGITTPGVVEVLGGMG